MKDWGGKNWHSFDWEMKKRYGGKVYRLSLASGCTCPNRDGSKGTGGCIFCSEGGSGEFAAECGIPLKEQIENAKRLISRKLKAPPAGYVAYFQSFSNTYGDVKRLERLYTEAAELPEILALSIATRPDCLGCEVMDMLKRLCSIKPVWVELGLQTVSDLTGKRINRAFDTSCFEEAVRKLKDTGIEVIAHVIAGLPGETEEDALSTVGYLAALDTGHGHIDGIKITLLYILEHTLLAEQYRSGKADVISFTEESYVRFLTEAVAMLPEDITVHRLTGDPPAKLVISPLWTTDKKHVLNAVAKAFKEKKISQGDLFRRNGS